jgi:hypothetical protein
MQKPTSHFSTAADGLLVCCHCGTCAAVMLTLARKSVITLTLPHAAAESISRRSGLRLTRQLLMGQSRGGAPSIMLAASQSGSAQQPLLDGGQVADCQQYNQAANAVMEPKTVTCVLRCMKAEHHLLG